VAKKHSIELRIILHCLSDEDAQRHPLFYLAGDKPTQRWTSKAVTCKLQWMSIVFLSCIQYVSPDLFIKA